MRQLKRIPHPAKITKREMNTNTKDGIKLKIAQAKRTAPCQQMAQDTNILKSGQTCEDKQKTDKK